MTTYTQLAPFGTVTCGPEQLTNLITIGSVDAPCAPNQESFPFAAPTSMNRMFRRVNESGVEIVKIAADEKVHHERAALPLYLFPTDQEIEQMRATASEHRRILDFTLTGDDEGIYGVAAHLGEGYEIEGNKIIRSRPDHRLRKKGRRRVKEILSAGKGLSQLDRMIFEDWTIANGEAVAPHESIALPTPWFRRASYLKMRIEILSGDQAEQLEQIFNVIEATKPMIEVFLRWLQRGEDKAAHLERGIRYFEEIAKQLVLVTDEDEPTLQFLEIDEEVEDDFPDSTVSVGYHLVEPRDVENFLQSRSKSQLIKMAHDHQMNADLDGLNKSAIVKELSNCDVVPVWEEMQPAAYKNLLKKVRACKDLGALKEIGKSTYALKMNKGQTGVFWYEYHKAKRLVTGSVEIGSVAKNFLAEIRRRKGAALGSFGKFLFKVQSGDVSVEGLKPSAAEWQVIWDAYKARKA
jgi:hypothetical protein